MIIKTIASSSKGNCYIVSDHKTTILLECGIALSRIRKEMGFKLSSVSGCLVSHFHADHCKSASDVIKAGIDIYMTGDTYSGSIGKDTNGQQMHHRVKIIEPMNMFSVGSMNIMPFPSIHDCKGSVGFLIASGEDRLLFITDSAYIPYQFKNVSILVIECNYQEDILKSNIDSGKIPVSLKNRLLFSHFSLGNVVKFIEKMDRSKLKECHLVHLSSGNSNAVQMQRKIAGIVGVPVYVAKE